MTFSHTSGEGRTKTATIGRVNETLNDHRHERSPRFRRGPLVGRDGSPKKKQTSFAIHLRSRPVFVSGSRKQKALLPTATAGLPRGRLQRLAGTLNHDLHVKHRGRFA